MPSIRMDYAVRETATNIKRNVFMAVAAVAVVAVSLLMAGGILLIIGSLNHFVDLQTHKVEVGVFLSPDVTPDQRQGIQRDLVAMPEVANVIYESKQDAYQRFKVLFRDAPDIVQNVTADALPESFRVKLKDPNRFAVVRDRLSGTPGIDRIQDQRQFLDIFLQVTRAVGGLGFFLIIVFTIAALVLIATTIRMAIFARRREIAIMKLVGATNWFIRVPFMLEGVAQGFVGALVATGMLFIFQIFIARAFHLFRFLEVSSSPLHVLALSVWLGLIGVVVGGLGSLVGLRRFLEV